MQTLQEFHRLVIEAFVYGGSVGTLVDYLSGIRGVEFTEERPKKVTISLNANDASAHFNPSGSILEVIDAVRSKIASDNSMSLNPIGRIRDNAKDVDFKVLKSGRQVCQMNIAVGRHGLTFKLSEFSREDRGVRDTGNQGGRRTRTPAQTPASTPAPQRNRPNNNSSGIQASEPEQAPNYGVTVTDIEDQGDGDRFYFGMARFTEVQADRNQYVSHIDFLEEEVPSAVAYAAVKKTEAGSIPRVGTNANVRALLKVSGAGNADFDAFTVLDKENLRGGRVFGRDGWANKGVEFNTISPNTVKGRKMQAILDLAKVEHEEQNPSGRQGRNRNPAQPAGETPAATPSGRRARQPSGN